MNSNSLVLYYSLGGQRDNILLTQGEQVVEEQIPSYWSKRAMVAVRP